MTAIKPEIYISWIPRGNISVKTQIFASIIPAEKVFTRTKADTDRRIGNYDETHADTLRKIGTGEIVHGDSLRTVKKFERVHGDTSRKIGLTTAHADTSRQVKNICETKADTLRKTGIKEKISAATSRNIKIFERVHGDTQRIFGAVETVHADTCRKMIERISAATCRKVVIPEKTFADTVIRIPHKLNYTVQPVLMRSAGLRADSAAPSIVNTFKNCNVTSFSVTLSEKTLSDVFEFQAAYDFNINDAINGQLLDYQFNFLVEEISYQGIVKSFKGMYDVDELLYSKIMLDENQVVDSDTAISSASNYVTAMAGYLNKTADIKIENFEPYNMQPDQNTTYRDFLSSLFGWTSRVPQRQINVFIRGDVLHCIQRGMEDSVFDITNLPHSRPAYDKKLLRTMWNRGDYDPSESREEDETSVPFNGTISFGGTTYMYSNGLLVSESHTITNAKIQSQSHIDYTYEAHFNKGSNKPSYYMSSKNENNTSVQIGTEFIYFSKNVKRTDGSTWKEELYYPDNKKTIVTSSTSYYYNHGHNGEIYLAEETETRQTSNYEPEDTATSEYSDFNIRWVLKSEETNLRQTFHASLGNGFYGSAVYENGAMQGSSISQGAPGGAVSQYTIDAIQRIFSNISGIKPKEGENEDRESLAPIADVSFPVADLQLVKDLTFALEWLNRKIQEEVTVDLLDKIVDGVPTINHIVDFTERVMLDGVEYCLVSNQIKLTPKKLVQTLRLIRWV